ncbi:MAG: hypothetical protein ACHWZW_20330 [Spirulina sp.]
MAALLFPPISDHGVAAPRQSSTQTNLARIATALAAVVGLWAMASQEASSQVPGLANGTYLYGESPIAATVGATYFVFEVSGTDLTGAVYQVSSSYDCVHGTVTPDALELTIVDAYDQTEWPHSVALMPGETTVAGLNGGAVLPNLEGMSPIAHLSALDRDVLATCQAR